MSLTDPVADVRPRFQVRCALWAAAAVPLFLCGPAAGTTQTAATEDFTELSLQELLDLQVTSVSKHAEPLRHAAAAISVLNGDEIRRAGARTIAEALRLVPGLQVYRSNAQNYTVTSRGFSGDKLEVLVDGRSVYSPLTSTVFWDVLDTFMADIDRIEVIRGPGATLWGANAVNGVINIVTKRAVDTPGTLTRAGGGKEERAYAAFSSGARIRDGAYGRLYAKAVERDSSVQRDGSETFDGQRHAEAGFRTDWSLAESHDLTVSGDYYHGRETGKALTSNSRADDTQVSGGNLLARWTWETSKDSELSVQAYFDGYHRLIPQIFEDRRGTGDLQVQHRFEWGSANTLTWGAGYRASHDDTGGPPAAIIFNPQSRTLTTYNAFGQFQRRFGEDGELTVGSKFEHDTYTGYEAQPGVRLGWALGERFFTWGAVSRAVRLPNRLDEDIAIFCSPAVAGLIGCTPGTTVPIGNRNFESEKLLAYEWGLRFWTERNFSADLTAFYNTYTDLRSTESTPPPFGSFANKLEADSYGSELVLNWTPLDWLRVRPFYSFLAIDADPDSDSTDANGGPNLQEGSPRHSAGLHFDVEPLSNVTMDGLLRYVGPLDRQQVPGYTELNLRVGWRPIPSLELAVVGADLLDDSHAEVGTNPSSTNPNPPPPQTEIEHAVWLDLLWEWE
jgi:iron complex outermembrane receptor protein